MTGRVDTLVLGAGATGLAVAHMLASDGQRVAVVDRAQRAGGLLATFEPSPGCRLEHFYHHFFTHDASLHWMLGELGLADRVHYASTTMGIVRGGRCYGFDGPRDLLRFDAIGMIPRLRFGASSALLMTRDRYTHAEDVAAMDWFRRTAGHAATEAIWAPMLRIKFGDLADRVPLAWMAGRLRQRARSRRGADERLGYMPGSLQVLVDRFVERLATMDVRLHLGTPVRGLLVEDGACAGAVAGAAGEDVVFRADRVVSTVPSPVLAEWVEPVDPAYAARLREIEYLGAICTILALPEPLSPVYWLNVADPGYDFGGVIEQTRFVDPSHYDGRHLVYLSRYLDVSDPIWTMDDETLLARQLAQLERLFGRPVPRLLDRWVFRGRYAAPKTVIGFPDRIPPFTSPIDGLYQASMAHVYPDERSVSNSIRVAAELVRAMGHATIADRVPKGISLAGKYG